MTWVSEFVVCAGWAGYVMAGFDLLWWVVVAKIGRAVGSRDYAFVAKYFKMGLCLSLVAAIFTAVLVFPFGPWLLDELFSLTPQVHSAAWPQLYLATVAKLLGYFKAVGLATVQGLQHLHVFVLLSCLDGLTAWGVPYLVEVAAHASQLWVAAAQVGRQLLWILVIFGYLGRFFQRQSSSGLIDLWGTKIEWLDWKIFLAHAASLLVAGYCAVVDAWLGVVVVNTIGAYASLALWCQSPQSSCPASHWTVTAVTSVPTTLAACPCRAVAAAAAAAAMLVLVLVLAIVAIDAIVLLCRGRYGERGRSRARRAAVDSAELRLCAVWRLLCCDGNPRLQVHRAARRRHVSPLRPYHDHQLAGMRRATGTPSLALPLLQV